MRRSWVECGGRPCCSWLWLLLVRGSVPEVRVHCLHLEKGRGVQGGHEVHACHAWVECRCLGWSWDGGARAVVLDAEALRPRGGSAMLKHTSLCESSLWKEMGRVLDQVLGARLVFECDFWSACS